MSTSSTASTGEKLSIDHFLRTMIEQDGSDLHLLAGDPPRVRRYGDLEPLSDEKLSPVALREALFSIMPARQQTLFDQHDGADFAYEIEGLSRFRVNVFRHIGGIGSVMRAIPSQALTLEELNLPDVIQGMCRHKQGLVLVTGKTGSGKSTTLAAMIDFINKERKGHILTIEDPIEFTHERRGCLMSQREVGSHTKSFAASLHSALREDPDVILVGEMRDLETIGIAVTAAETGILVMGTLHTNGAASTVDRIVNTFPADKQSQIRSMLSTSLKGVISQQLCKKAGGKGRVAALEIMVSTPAVGNLIRQGKLDQLETAMQSGGNLGMKTMDSALMALLKERQIEPREAYEKAMNKSKFESFVSEPS
ncbi:MAG: type IV pilus twitching motility protein PilT [Pseudomonadota bacterium]